MKIVITLSLAAMTALLIGCGGGSSGGGTPTSSIAGGGATSSTATVKNGGIFVDAAVKGLSYTCHTSETTGTTDATGRYDCAEGDTTVTFAIGTRNLGTTTIADIITPRSFFNGANRDDEILNLAQLLQTMDKDGNPDNGIELDADDILNWQSSHTGFDNASFDTLVGNELGKLLVSETSAHAHINGILSQYGFSEIGGLMPIASSSSSQSSVASSSSTSSSSSQASDNSDRLHVSDVSSLYGYTIEATHTSRDSKYAYIIDCSGDFRVTFASNGKILQYATLTGNSISIGVASNGGGISFDGTDTFGHASDNYIGFKNQNQTIVVGESTPDGLLEWFITSITKDSTCN